METPQKRQKSWLSSLTGLVSGSRSSSQPPMSSVSKLSAQSSITNGDGASARFRSAKQQESTPSRYSGTFSAPAIDSPESPAKRASPTLMAQRKIHGRVQGPSSRLGASSNHVAASDDRHAKSFYGNSSSLGRYAGTPRRTTNFSSATTPRNMFRDSISRDMPSFTFTPRVPPNTMRGNFPAATPGRSYRAPGIELSGRGMAKTSSSSDLFPMKIPDPDPELTGEAIANLVPKDLKAGTRSVYANEYLARFCPPDFNEEQRNQFFCILDLRRLKYAADEVFAKKDWRLNILNFAKEYEKNRSLIMLRYGLYEFKTVKVSKDVFRKWKANHNIPDLDDEEAEDDTAADSTSTPKASTALTTSRLNGTEGILRTGKRKAQDDIDPSSMAASTSAPGATGNKRTRGVDGSRAAEREPLTETTTPSLNKSSKRKGTGAGDAEQLRRAKLQKPVAGPSSSATPSATPSATKTFLEKVANSPAKEAAPSPSIHVSKPAVENGTAAKPSLFKANSGAQLSKPTNGSLARSVLESGLKANPAQNSANIFGYLSDASSAKGSQNDNADADAEDTDESEGQEESEAQGSDNQSAVASGSNGTPQPASSLFGAKPPSALSAFAGAAAVNGGSATSSEASDAAPSRSLFDRINKGSDGQPLRMFGGDSGSASQPAPLFGSKPASARHSPEKESSGLFSANKTWTPDTPIKFSAGASSTPAKPLFGASSPAASATTTAALAPVAGKDTSSATLSLLFGSTAATTPAAPAEGPKEPAKIVPASSAATAAPAATAAAEPSTQAAAPPLFGFLNKPAGSGATAAPLFGSASAGAGASSAAVSAAPASTLFGKPQEAPAATSAPSLFGAKPVSESVLKSQTLFGSTPKADALPQTAKRAADSKPPTSTPLFGSTAKRGPSDSDEPSAKRPLFGGSDKAPAASAPPSLFSFGAAKANGVSEADKAKPSEEPAKPLFSNGLSNGAPKTPAANLFGGSAAPAPSATTGSLFSFGGSNASAPSTTQPSTSMFSFGASTAPSQPASAGQTSTPMFGGGSGSGGDTGSAGSSFTFSVGGGGGQSFHNPFASGGGASGSQAAPSLSFGAGQSGAASSSPFQFGAGSSSSTATATTSASPALFSFGAGSQPTGQGAAAAPATASGSVFGSTPSAGNAIFNFGGAPSSTPLFGQQKPANGGSMFNLAPPMGGTSTGTNTPFTNLGGASSLATTPATGTPEPGATQDNSDHNGHQADGDEAPQEQISLTEGGPGEEDEAVVHEVRAKALKLVTAKDGADGDSPAAKDKKSPWKTEGVGPLRVLKHKTTGAVRLLLRAEPRGNVALNKALLPDFTYKPEPNAKYVKLTTANESGSGLETWMLQVKTKDAAQKLADILEENKLANKK